MCRWNLSNTSRKPGRPWKNWRGHYPKRCEGHWIDMGLRKFIVTFQKQLGSTCGRMCLWHGMNSVLWTLFSLTHQWRVCCSPDGKLLASVGGDPDYMLTLWDWKREKIVLRSKAFSQDIFRITFSTELIGQLTTSGVGHIRCAISRLFRSTFHWRVYTGLLSWSSRIESAMFVSSYSI